MTIMEEIMKKDTNITKDVDKLESSYIAGKNVKFNRHFGKL